MTRRTRLITRATRPDLYEQLADAEKAANDFRREYRRQHPILAAIAWCAESEWRMLAMIGAAIIIGSVAGFAAAMTFFTAEQKRACAERELKMRERVYPRWIADRRMTQAKADEEIALMRAIMADYADMTAGERLL
jgi:hypothetical protein